MKIKRQVRSMSSKLYTFCLLLAFTVLSVDSVMAQLSTVGKEFIFGFMENYRVDIFDNPANSALDFGIVLITAAEDAEGFIEYRNQRVAFNLKEGEQFFYKIENEDMLHRFSGVVENKSVYVFSSGNVSVYAFNERIRSADGTVVLPIASLGKDYYVTSHFEIMRANTEYNYSPNVNDESIFLVIAIEDDTQIEITPSVFTLSGNAANIPYTVTLNAGQSYQVKAKADLTGTRIRVVGDNAADCKNIAAFGGNKWTSVGDCGGANDHLFQHLYPIKTWGTDYLHVSLAGRTSGELVKVLASENSTQVTVDGQNVGTLDAGEFITLDFESDVIKLIQTDKPSAVTVFSKSQECNRPGAPLYGDGDPFMISYSPNQQLLTAVTFNAIQLPVVTSHYVNVIVKSSAVGGTFLDAQNIGNSFAVIPQAPEFSYARISIGQGVHRLQNEEGFIAYVYGFGDVESYGYAAGASLNNLNFEVSPNYDFEVEGDRVACLNQEGSWEIFPENEIFTYFIWDFGDESEKMEGKEVQHTFTKKGEYEVRVIASISPNSCDQQEEIIFAVKVKEILGEIKGINSACPELEDLLYFFETEDEYAQLEWQVEGGEITQVNEEEGSVRVLWGMTNPNASVQVTPFTLDGCPQAPVTLSVNISEIILSEMADGAVQVCFDPDQFWEYSVTNTSPERGYEWEIENGSIVEDDGIGQIKIQWDIPGVMGKVKYREFSLLDNLCEGTSPELEVFIADRFEVQEVEIMDAKCFGEASGAIKLAVSGGQIPLSFSWGHDETIDSPEVSGLLAGSYQVIVRDANGCELIVQDLEVSQPDLLEVANLEIEAVSCFGRADGAAKVTLIGGVAPFSVNYEEATVIGNEVIFENLEGMAYSFEVDDANGCRGLIELDIPTPKPENLVVQLQKPTCPGEANGSLLVLPNSLIAPYVFRWEGEDGDSQLLTGLSRGVYPVEVTDSRGCIGLGVGEVLDDAPMVRMPTGYKIEEGFFQGVSNCEIEFTLRIFNRWGELIYFGEEGWDGKIHGKEAPMGTYSYLFQYSFELEGQLITKENRGIFTLLY